MHPVPRVGVARERFPRLGIVHGRVKVIEWETVACQFLVPIGGAPEQDIVQSATLFSRHCHKSKIVVPNAGGLTA